MLFPQKGKRQKKLGRCIKKPNHVGEKKAARKVGQCHPDIAEDKKEKAEQIELFWDRGVFLIRKKCPYNMQKKREHIKAANHQKRQIKQNGKQAQYQKHTLSFFAAREEQMQIQKVDEAKKSDTISVVYCK